MQKLFSKLFGQAGRLDADQEAANAVVTAKRKDKESGATAIEYGLIAALISVAVIGSVTLIGQNANKTFNKVATNLGK